MYIKEGMGSSLFCGLRGASSLSSLLEIFWVALTALELGQPIRHLGTAWLALSALGSFSKALKSKAQAKACMSNLEMKKRQDQRRHQ